MMGYKYKLEIEKVKVCEAVGSSGRIRLMCLSAKRIGYGRSCARHATCGKERGTDANRKSCSTLYSKATCC